MVKHTLSTQVEGRVAILTVDHPRNTISTAILRDIAREVQTLEANPKVRSLLLTTAHDLLSPQMQKGSSTLVGGGPVRNGRAGAKGHSTNIRCATVRSSTYIGVHPKFRVSALRRAAACACLSASKGSATAVHSSGSWLALALASRAGHHSSLR